ncbi:MAG: polysulfide reductase NrfD [Deltaproteobacteria bacterium]|nr:polysulfide reductase NrfD [Deltaproteobacteria bacterium]
MNEIEVNRASNLIDPNLQIWGWEIPVYLFLGGLTAGIMILSALLGRGKPIEERSRLARWLPFAAPLLLSLGMVALFLDLAYKLHVFRFYAAFRWTSPMSWGSWILVAIYPVTLLFGLSNLTADEVERLAGWRPLAMFRLGWVVRLGRRIAEPRVQTLRIASVVLGIGLGGYTGLLLGTLGARLVWSSGVLGPLFLVSGVSTGAALMMLFRLRDDERRWLRSVDIGAIVVELGLLGAYLLGLATSDAGGREAAEMFLGGPYTATFWSLVVIAGLLVPLLIESLEARRHLRHTALAPALLLIGGLSLRWILVVAGQA